MSGRSMSGPLDVGPLDGRPTEIVGPGAETGWAPAHQRRSELLGALLSSSLGRPYSPRKAAADVL